MVNCVIDHRLTAHYRGNAFAGEFRIPVDLFPSAHSLFLKLERRSLFFDEAGWIEVPPAVSRQTASPLVAEPSLAVR